MQQKSLLHRWLSFGLWVGIVWAFTFVVCPAIVSSSSEMTAMHEFIEMTGIETGEFFYTDVEVCGDAELGARSTFEYTPRTMEIAHN